MSRLVGRLRQDFDPWRSRDLAPEGIRYGFMDRWYPEGRISGRCERVPVLVTLGVRANGKRMVLDMLDIRLVGEESATSWIELVASRAARHLARPVPGGDRPQSGERRGPALAWPGIAIQRCRAHKLRNLQAKTPARLREELTEDYRRMIYGETVAAVEQSRTRFIKKLQRRSPRSLRA